MSDTKYNFDDYIFDNVFEDTYLAIKDIDKVCENFEWNEVTQAESMSADMVRGHRKAFVEPACGNDGSEIELGD